MRIHPALTGLALALSVTACQQPAAGPGSSAPAPAAAPASLRVVDEAGSVGPFAMRSLTKLNLDASFPAAAGKHTVRVDAIRPDRGVHASLVGTVVAGPDGVATLRQTLEVAGSPIEQYHLTGTWSFALAVDDGPQVVAASVVIGD